MEIGYLGITLDREREEFVARSGASSQETDGKSQGKGGFAGCAVRRPDLSQPKLSR